MVSEEDEIIRGFYDVKIMLRASKKWTIVYSTKQNYSPKIKDHFRKEGRAQQTRSVVLWVSATLPRLALS